MNVHEPPSRGADPGTAGGREGERGSAVRAIAAAIACVTTVGIGIGLSLPLLSLEMERMNASGALIGANTAIAGIASICVVPFVPRAAARVGVVRLLWASILTGIATLVAFKALHDIVWWFPIRFLFSASLGVLFTLSEYWINAAAPPHRRGLVMGIYAAVLAAGFAAGPTLLAVVGTSGWAPYLTGAALFGLAGLPLALARGLSPELHGRSRRSVLSFILAAPTATLAALVFGAVETGSFALLPVYGLHLGLGPEAAAFLVSVVALGNVAFQIPIGLVSDRTDRRRLLLGLGCLGAVGALLIPLVAADKVALYVVLALWGGFGGALYTVGLAHLGARFGGPDLANANAAFVILYNVGLIVGPPVVGSAMDAVRPDGFAWSLAAFFGLYVLVVAGRLVRLRPRP